jgi:hypothetical protein
MIKKPTWRTSNTIANYTRTQPMCDVVSPEHAKKIVAYNNKLRKKLEKLGWVFRDHWHVWSEPLELEFSRPNDPFHLRLKLRWEHQFQWFPMFSMSASTQLHPNDKYRSPWIRMEIDAISERHLTKPLMDVYINNIITAILSQKTIS